MTDITQLLIESREGKDGSVDRLFECAYSELRRLAKAQLRRQSGGTLLTTELVHEAYLKLFDQQQVDLVDRVHFLSLAARAMRQVLIDHFRSKSAAKRGKGFRFEPLDGAAVAASEAGPLVLAVDEALTRLARRSERLSKVAEYKFFGGMTQDEIGAALGLSVRTVNSDWSRAKVWLTKDLADQAGRAASDSSV